MNIILQLQPRLRCSSQMNQEQFPSNNSLKSTHQRHFHCSPKLRPSFHLFRSFGVRVGGAVLGFCGLLAPSLLWICPAAFPSGAPSRTFPKCSSKHDKKCQLSRLARQQGFAGSRLRQQAAGSMHRRPAKEHGLSAAGTGALTGPTLPNTSSSSALCLHCPCGTFL